MGILNELRVGNWVLGKNNTPRKVAYVGETIGLYNRAGGTDKYQHNPIISNNIDELRGIPLTDEIVLKSNIDKIHSYFSTNGEYSINI